MTFSQEKNQFQMSYSRRVDRPGLEQTKPIREFSTQGNFCWKSRIRASIYEFIRIKLY
jgi:hypothetical protein